MGRGRVGMGGEEGGGKECSRMAPPTYHSSLSSGFFFRLIECTTQFFSTNIWLLIGWLNLNGWDDVRHIDVFYII